MQGLLGRIVPLVLLWMGLALPLLGVAADGATASLPSRPVVVVHPTVALNSPSRNLLRSIFSMRLNRWPDGSPIEVLVLPDTHPVHQNFAKQVLGIFPYQLRQSWDRAVYSGTGVAPTQVETPEEMRRRVAETPGAIGYLPRTMLDREVRHVEME